MESEIFLPTLMHWQYKNSWYGSLKRASFLVTPGEGTLSAELWTGPAIHEHAVIEQTAQFPLTEEGLVQLHGWLLEQAQLLNRAAAERPYFYQW